MRKLVSIQVISSVEPIENADKIELVHVLGWQCVAKKGEFKQGDRCVYFEVDSFLPIRSEFEFLRASSYKSDDYLGEGFRLRTQKFRGVLSQGLCLPVSNFPELSDVPVGTDVRDLLGVKKWEIEEFSTSDGTVINTLPDAVSHTSEVRVQEEPGLIEAFANQEYYISTKMDGHSCSLCIDSNGFHVTGHNYEYADDGKSPFFEYVKLNRLQDKMTAYFFDNGLQTLVIQGEFCGPDIRKNHVGLLENKWFVFTIKVNGDRVDLKDMEHICQSVGLDMVPIEEVGFDLPLKYPTVDALLTRSDGSYPSGKRKEGIVIRTVVPIYCDLIGTWLSMKIVSNKFLVKCES